jgi:cob(I)alamin adenosyltransferase
VESERTRPGETASHAALGPERTSATPARPGYVHVYTGDGKGKTTAALGLALRAAGRGRRVFIGQFMKGQAYGELAALAGHRLIRVEQFGSPGCVRRHEVTQAHVDEARQGLVRSLEALTSGEYDIVILDELSVAVWFGLLSEEDCAALLRARPAPVELVVTGRRAPDTLLAAADLVTEMREVRHYYQQGVPAREGIEY